MKCDTPHHDAQALNAALGTPKYYIDTPGLKEEETYAWFPTSGSSMTDNTARSIPGGSLVLGRLLQGAGLEDIPLHRPIVVIIDDNGTRHCMLKSGCAIKEGTPAGEPGMLCLRSYNPATWCDDFWMPFSSIRYVFVVELVRLKDGTQFVPRQEEVVRNGKTG